MRTCQPMQRGVDPLEVPPPPSPEPEPGPGGLLWLWWWWLWLLLWLLVWLLGVVAVAMVCKFINECIARVFMVYWHVDDLMWWWIDDLIWLTIYLVLASPLDRLLRPPVWLLLFLFLRCVVLLLLLVDEQLESDRCSRLRWLPLWWWLSLPSLSWWLPSSLTSFSWVVWWCRRCIALISFNSSPLTFHFSTTVPANHWPRWSKASTRL